jgi:hypothetical protein
MKFSSSSLHVLLLSAAGLTGSASGATFRMWDPTPYRSALDSPFYEGIQGDLIFLEDFEDGLLNTPYVRDPLVFPQMGITFRTRVPDVAPGRVASVDGDDGLLDFEGDQGDSWITTQNASGLRSFFEFEFEPNEDGHYPLFVGIVVTEVADIFEEVAFGVFGESGLNLATSAEFDPRLWFDMNLRGDVETHRFIGFYAEEGIRRFRARNTLQVDHLQYGYAIPEPSVAALVALTAFALHQRQR